MKAGIIAGAAALSLLCGQALANKVHQQALADLEANALAFIGGAQLAPVAPETLTGDDYYSKKHFPAVQEPAPLRVPDADLDPLTRSILVVDAHEGPLPHVRYHLAYSMDVPAEVPEL